MKKKTNKKKQIKIITKLVFLIPLAILVSGINIFWIGFHNLDLCHNEGIIQGEVNKEFNKLGVSNFIIREKKVDGEIWSLGDCYLGGLKGIITGFYLSIIGAFSLGYIIR